jgi:hypothetical protein
MHLNDKFITIYAASRPILEHLMKIRSVFQIINPLKISFPSQVVIGSLFENNVRMGIQTEGLSGLFGRTVLS